MLSEYFRSCSSEKRRNDVPIFLSLGSKDEQFKEAKEKFLWLKTTCNQLEMKEYNKGHQMISSQDEMKDIFQFLSQFLYLRNLALENQADVIEINEYVELKHVQ